VINKSKRMVASLVWATSAIRRPAICCPNGPRAFRRTTRNDIEQTFLANRFHHFSTRESLALGRGVSLVYANRLVGAFGEKVFEVIEATPDRLREIERAVAAFARSTNGGPDRYRKRVGVGSSRPDHCACGSTQAARGGKLVDIEGPATTVLGG
jgi:hypothetical protein